MTLDPSRRDLAADDAGAVYVEFLMSFPPVFLLFLGLCQLSLIGAARLVVAHAATRAVRAAVVVLEDDPAFYGNAPRGSLSAGTPVFPDAEGELRKRLWFVSLVNGGFADPGILTASGGAARSGARIAAIRSAAYVPLSVLAPAPGRPPPGKDALDGSFAAESLAYAAEYDRAASAVTLQVAPGNDALAPEPVPYDGDVTVRVTYLYTCTVPLVRTLLCSSRDTLVGTTTGPFGLKIPARSPTGAQRSLSATLNRVEKASDLDSFAAHGERFIAIVAEATLPNQGAKYYQKPSS